MNFEASRSAGGTWSDDLAKMVMLRLNIGSDSGSAHACSALASDPYANKARGAPPLASNGLGSEANAEHASAEPESEPMLSLSMTILAKSSDQGQMKILKSADFI